MSKTVRTTDKNLELHLFDDGVLEIESKIFKCLGIEVRRLDQSGGTVASACAPPGAFYEISTYFPEPNAKRHPCEHTSVYVGKDGIMWQELISRLSCGRYKQDVKKIIEGNM